MNIIAKPKLKPRPNFSSGPTAKPVDWSADWIDTSMLGRSHRSKAGLGLLQKLLSETKKLLKIPESHKLFITPGSATGAIETAFWNLLGPRTVDIVTSDVFGERWTKDLRENLQLENIRVLGAPSFGEPAALHTINPQNDVVYVHNGTTSGVIVPDFDWILDSRSGLVICDATSAAFGRELDWDKLDATAFSWQKILGGEAGFGMLVLSPSALERLQSYKPTWPIPLLYQINDNAERIDLLCSGYTINTISLMSVFDCLGSLNWLSKLGGVSGAIKKINKNFEVLESWVNDSTWCDFLVTDSSCRSPISVTLKFIEPDFIVLDEGKQREKIQTLVDLLTSESVAYDFRNHLHVPPSLRIWCGPTVELKDLKLFTEWLDWGWGKVYL